MRATAWRPSTALRKRRSAYLSLLDASGVAAIFVFFLAMYLLGTTPIHRGNMVDLPPSIHPKLESAALKEDAITVVVTRDGSLYFRNTKVPLEKLPGLIQNAVERGAERKVYLKADARAKYGDAESAIDMIRQAGIRDLAILVEQARQPND